ncbi:tetratricopeptide repeat protein [Oscillochloris sp. ZM17-4]|uniref:tetratricopeptide repeat protein n=1 Tax=Oscillochloris sp. ZM17-4 TaxID=2866714 RepID=UPI001C734AE6|nr:adenylate/guanylate cyclase domain-containing protein [Oscillochloris sp. ZM17-4]MBX0330346.1 tetratricopeptide repeat protein [Oscillochloris sp. ZM17-4]
MTTQGLTAYLPIDRCHALASGDSLPDRSVGAVLFADISGFTPLTNSLARELGPQRGAEELSRQLNAIYTALVAQVHGYHGSVIGFAGDAITCWFAERGVGARSWGLGAAASSAADRAAACALDMQREMESFAALRTPAGTVVTLAMKVSVAYGPVRRFLVGAPQIQMIDALAGRTVDRMVAGEHVAQKGEVIISAEVPGALSAPPQIGGWREDEEGQRFAVLRGLGAPVGPAPWPEIAWGGLGAEQLRGWLLPPIYARLEAGQGQFLADLRPAFALFVSFSGIDYDHDDAAGEKLDAYVRWAQGIIGRYEGSLLQLTIGDKGSYFYGAFGAPLAHEDDAARSAEAALMLRTPPAELGFISDVRIGISHGRLRTGAYGSADRLTYGVLGEEVNMAARLMQAAGPGQIYVNESARQGAAAAFAWEQLPPLQVKGRDEPLTAYRLLGAVSRQQVHVQSAMYSLPMVGRQAELDQIARMMTEAIGGQGRIVAITAEAGLGKSRLVVECIQMGVSRRMAVYSGEAQSYGTSDSYLAWESILQAFFGLDRSAPAEEQVGQLEAALRAIDPDLLPRMPLLGLPLNLPIPDNNLTQSLDSRLRKISLEALLVACLRVRSQASPLMIVIEDSHWLDPLSHDLIEIVGRAIFDMPVLIVVAYRPPELDYLRPPRVTTLPYCTVIQLTELSQAEAAELVGLKQVHLDMASDLPADVIDQLVARAQGNPFFIEELLNYLHTMGAAPRNARELEQLDLPTSLYSLILSRIDQLSENQKTTLKVASVIGRSFRAAWLWGIHPSLGLPSQVRADLDAMSRMELTLVDQPDPEWSYLFKHILTHGVAYESLPFETRAWLHGQVGAFIEQAYVAGLEPFLDVLAFHFDHSTEEEKRRTYLRRAGEAAQAAYANATAIDYYQRLLGLLPENARGPVLFRLGQVLDLVGEWDDAASSYQQALDLAEATDDARMRVECQQAIGRLLRKRGSYEDALVWLERAGASFGGLDDQPGAIQTLADIGEIYRLQGNYARAGQCYQQALDLADLGARTPALLSARANVLKGGGTLANQQGDLLLAQVRYEESLSMLRELGDRPGVAGLLNNLGVVALFGEDYPASAAAFAESLIMLRQLGDRWAMGAVLNNWGMTARGLGDISQARTLLEESVAVRRGLGDKGGVANSLSTLANLLLHNGKLDDLPAMLRESLELNVEVGDRTAIAYCLEDYAGLAAAQGVAERAIRLASAAASLRAELGTPLPAAEQQALDRLLTPARTTLGARADAVWATGQVMSFEEAVALALQG